MGDEPNRARAEEIIGRVVPLQDKDPASRTYGIWSWFMEEPAEARWRRRTGTGRISAAPSSCRWRSSIATAFPKTWLEQVDAAVIHAGNAIKRRDVQPGYTNIAIMGSYVTIVAGEQYGNQELREYGLARLKKFHDYSFHHGGFTEYNSPTYTVVALTETGAPAPARAR